MAQTGKRAAEMHLALASTDALPDFAPEPTRPEDVERWIEETMIRADRVFDTTGSGATRCGKPDRQLIDQVARRSATSLRESPERLVSV